jgi:signal transduction histidine kinase
MTQQPIQSSPAGPSSKSVPSTGMRGGLGRTLLIAFLLLSIVPLSLISFVASAQGRRNLQRELQEKLVTVATHTESQIYNWVANQQLILTLLSKNLWANPQGDSPTVPLVNSNPSPPFASQPGDEEFAQTFAVLYKEIAKIQAQNPAFMALLLLDQQGYVLAAYPSIPENHAFPELLQGQQMLLEAEEALIHAFTSSPDRVRSPALVLTQPVADNNLTLVALLDPHSLIQTVSTSTSWGENGEIYLVLPSRQTLELRPAADTDHTYLAGTPALQQRPRKQDSTDATDAGDQIAQHHSMAIEAALAGQSGATSYENYQGVPVIGAYRWLPGLNMALIVEQQRDTALASSDDLAVMLIGATLAVALLTALIAAAVTRRITLPIVQLTATAVQIAAGDLDQKVPATRRDEIGILARAFNVMTTKLQLLYEDLEQKVRERTQQLQEANAEIRYRAMQLAISAEVAQVVTSILDRELLLSRVVELIRDCFQAYFVAIFFIDKSGKWAIMREGSGWLGEQLKAEGYQVDLSQDSLVSQAANSLRPRVCTGDALNYSSERRTFPHTRAELCVPMKIGQRRIGVLDVHSAHEDAFAGDEIVVLESLTGQIAIAIENARAYEMERQAVKQLRELEELRRRFLSNMSRELRMPLNNIIGFSRVILKGIDGPITDLQREDLNAIYESGQQLLALINDILDIAQLEAGTMELAVRPVDLGEIVRSATPTINALLQGRPIEFHQEVTSNLPLILADPFRLRQVLVKLLSNAIKFTQEGKITLRVWPNSCQVLVSISDTGIGIPDEYQEKVFEIFEQLPQSNSNTQGTGLGLTFSKEIVEMHGGTIRLESKEGEGATFIISLPILEDSLPVER